MRGLTIKEPWLSKILSGSKTWEIRTRKTNLRERIALVRGGASEIAGYATLADCLQISREEMTSYTHKHCAQEDDLAAYGNPEKPLYAWVLENIEMLEKPIPFERKPGSVNWVNVPDRM